MKIAAGLNKTNNAAYWCGDTGGYNGSPSDELYIRWLEYTTFTPCQEFFGAKTNSTGNRFPWGFSAQAQQMFQKYTQLRYRLLPFRYSNAQIAYHEKPVKYPVKWRGSTQLMVGNGSSEILVQPVTTQGATSATVELPAGARWIHYWTGTSHEGGSSVKVAAPIDQEPIFVKAGSIIPMGPPLRWVDQVPADPLTLDIYPAGQTSYTLYEDDGMTTAYQAGAYSTTLISCDARGGRLQVTIGATTVAKYAHPGLFATRTYVLKLNQQGSPPGAVKRDGTPLVSLSAADFDSSSEGWFYDPASKVVWVQFKASTSVSTSIEL
jgi:alpha-glucosidase (family GH31 glycosyl hydrolase)